MSKLQNCDEWLTVGGYGIPAVAINRYNYYWQWLRLLAMTMAMAMEGVSKLNQCGLRSALPLARARKPNNHIAQGSALGVECIY